MKKIYFVIFTLLTYAGHAQEKKQPMLQTRQPFLY